MNYKFSAKAFFVFASLLIAATVLAHGGVDDEAPAPGGTATASTSAIIVAKETQFALNILTEPVQTHELSDSRNLVGTIVPRTDARADVYAPQPGKIRLMRAIKIGDKVTKGESLLSIEQVLSGTEKLALDRDKIDAEKELNEAKKENARKRALEGVVPQKEIELSAIRLRAAEQRNASIQQALSDGTKPVLISAPISGLISSADLVSGEYVDATRKLLEITDVSTVWIQAAAYESDLRTLTSNLHASIVVPTSGRLFDGIYVASNNTVNAETRAVSLIFSVPNPNGELKIGGSAKVNISIGVQKEALSVSREALVNVGGTTYVFVHNSPETFLAKEVTIGQGSSGQYSEITSGLKPNERVVVSGVSILKGKLAQ